MLSIAAKEDLEMAQFDIKTAFLNAELNEQMFMEVPKGFNDAKENMVCRLKKSLYELKQSSRAWNKTFTKFLNDYNLIQSKADPCVFSGSIDEIKVILLLYVDDGLTLTKCKNTLERVLSHLSQKFEVTRCSDRHYVGMEIHRDRKRQAIFINQSSYIQKVIEKFNMQGSKSVSTPADSNIVLTKASDEEQKIVFLYRQAIGSLMFAAIVTRPDISFAIGAVSRYMEKPGNQHVSAVKRIL